MTRRVVVGCEEVLAPFMDFHCQAHGAFAASNGRGIAVVELDEQTSQWAFIAGVWFEGYNGANMNIHVASVGNGQWISRALLSAVFHYAFVQCGVRRLTGLVEESNTRARRFDEHLGFRLETRLKDAAPSGDLLVYVLRKEDCRFLNMPLPKVMGVK